MSKKVTKYAHCLAFEPREFLFINGDTYEGEYMIDPTNNTIFRHGFGTYTNLDGLKLSGNWIKDAFAGEMKIEFGDSMIYKGFLSKSSMTYTVGEIRFPDGSKFIGDFKKNFEGKRVDGVTFYDPNGKKWNHSLTHDNEILLEFEWQQDTEDCNSPCK